MGHGCYRGKYFKTQPQAPPPWPNLVTKPELPPHLELVALSCQPRQQVVCRPSGDL
jgi:hypothetical protein